MNKLDKLIEELRAEADWLDGSSYMETVELLRRAAMELAHLAEQSAMTATSMGKKGGKARAAKLSPERRLEISLKAADVRWRGKRD